MCVSDLNNCPSINTLKICEDVTCWNNQCAENYMGCRSSSLCPNETPFRCPNNICVVYIYIK